MADAPNPSPRPSLRGRATYKGERPLRRAQISFCTPPTSRSEAVMVAVGFQPTVGTPAGTRRVATVERSLTRSSRDVLWRSSVATRRRAFPASARGLKPTATIYTSLRDEPAGRKPAATVFTSLRDEYGATANEETLT